MIAVFVANTYNIIELENGLIFEKKGKYFDIIFIKVLQVDIAGETY